MGRKQTEKTKIKISNSKKGTAVSEKTKRKISDSLKGRELSKSHKEKISKSLKGRRGEKHHCWKGGKKIQRGYVYIWFKDKYRREQIVKIENKIGRKLKTSECVHHKNGNRLDNRLSNLALMSNSEHTAYHNKLRIS